MKYGYVRVSTKEQNIARQIFAMNQLPKKLDKIYIDKISGKNFDRTEYKKMLKKLNKNDELYIKSIDRLGRNYEQIIEQWNFLTKVKEVNIIVMDFPLLDTRNKDKTLTGKFIADIVLQILSYVAQIERENIKQRQFEGIKAAKAKGVKFGRPSIIKPPELSNIIKLYASGNITLREGAKQLNVSHVTLYKWIKELK